MKTKVFKLERRKRLETKRLNFWQKILLGWIGVSSSLMIVLGKNQK